MPRTCRIHYFKVVYSRDESEQCDWSSSFFGPYMHLLQGPRGMDGRVTLCALWYALNRILLSYTRKLNIRVNSMLPTVHHCLPESLEAGTALPGGCLVIKTARDSEQLSGLFLNHAYRVSLTIWYLRGTPPG